MPRIARRRLLAELALRRGWTRISEPEWNEAAAAIPGLTPKDVEGSGLPADAPWSGVRLHTFDDLAASLIALADVYAARPDLRPFCRRLAIEAKTRARAASRNLAAAESKRAVKAEMTEWMLVWLGDPALFEPWVKLRLAQLARCEGP